MSPHASLHEARWYLKLIRQGFDAGFNELSGANPQYYWAVSDEAMKYHFEAAFTEASNGRCFSYSFFGCNLYLGKPLCVSHACRSCSLTVTHGRFQTRLSLALACSCVHTAVNAFLA